MHVLRSRQEHHQLNTSLHEIEVAVHRGRTAEAKARKHDVEEGDDVDAVRLEMQLQDLARGASSLGQGGGLLHGVKEFNAFLEKAVEALEG